MKIKRSRIIDYFSESDTPYGIFESILVSVFLTVVNGLILIAVREKYPTVSNLWLFLGISIAFSPFILGGLEMVITNTYSAIANVLSSVPGKIALFTNAWRSKKATAKSEQVLNRLFNGEINLNKVQPFFPREASLSGTVLNSLAEEFFSDQLGRVFCPCEAVRVLQQEVHEDNEVLALICFERRTSKENGFGAIDNAYDTVTVGVRFKHFPEHQVIITEFIRAFPGLTLHQKQMWSIVKDTVSILRQSEETYLSAYDDDPQKSNVIPL